MGPYPGAPNSQSRSYLYVLGPKVGPIHILGALGIVSVVIEAPAVSRCVDAKADSNGKRTCVDPADCSLKVELLYICTYIIYIYVCI